MTDDHIGVDQKNPDQLIKIIFVGRATTAIRSDINSTFGIRGFSPSDTVWGLWFSL